MKYLITGRARIEAGISPQEPYIVISIRDPGRRHANIKSKPRDVLYLSFDDAERVEGLPVHSDVLLMTEAQARLAWRFFRRYQGEIATLVCHCEMGKHRSPALAAALCKGSGGEDAGFFTRFQPNMYVYRLMLSSL